MTTFAAALGSAMALGALWLVVSRHKDATVWPAGLFLVHALGSAPIVGFFGPWAGPPWLALLLIGLPAYLLRQGSSSSRTFTAALVTLSLLTTYALTSALFTPAPIEGVKTAFYVAGLAANGALLASVTFTETTVRRLSGAAGAAFTYALITQVPKAAGGEHVLQTFRLSPPIGPQAWAFGLVALSFMAAHVRRPGWLLILTGSMVLLSGSRAGFAGWFLAVALAISRRMGRGAPRTAISAILAAGSISLLLIPLDFAGDREGLQLRSLEAISVALEDPSAVGDIGTVKRRIELNSQILAQLHNLPMDQQILGAGTASTAMMVSTHAPGFVEDFNRVSHNEYLRAALEWGVPGILLLLAYLVVAFRARIGPSDRRTRMSVAVMAAYLAASFAAENLLSMSATSGVWLAVTPFLAVQSCPAPRE